jgi:Fe-S oxidoreductase
MRFRSLVNMAGENGSMRRLQEKALGLTAKRDLPWWSATPWQDPGEDHSGEAGLGEVVLFADTFNRYFEPDNVRAAETVLKSLGYPVGYIRPSDGGRPACCGRTLLSMGFIDEARAESARFLKAVMPAIRRGATLVGLEPSCLFSMRDEFAALHKGDDVRRLASQALMFEEFLMREAEAGRIKGPIAQLASNVLVHGHCHQKSFGAAGSVVDAFELVEGAKAQMIESGCCGMAGSFGYQAETYETSVAMGELDLLPAVRAAPEEAIIAADGFSCRHQIRDLSGREAKHTARIIADAIIAGADISDRADV